MSRVQWQTNFPGLLFGYRVTVWDERWIWYCCSTNAYYIANTACSTYNGLLPFETIREAVMFIRDTEKVSIKDKIFVADSRITMDHLEFFGGMYLFARTYVLFVNNG